MRTQHQSIRSRYGTAPFWLVLFAVVLLAGTVPAHAVEYIVFGQILQVDPEDAEDEDLTDAALSGGPRPYARVRLYDTDTGLLLGEVDAGQAGTFTLRYDQPAGASPNIEGRVFHLVEDPDTAVQEARALPAAREEINTFSSIDQYQSVTLKVLADDELHYGSAEEMTGFVTTPGVGLVFTRVGRVETQFIAQNTTAVGGLADFSSDPSAPGNLGVPDFRQAPFAGRLFVYGDFGVPSNTVACSGYSIDYYRILIEPVGGTAEVWSQPLLKTRTLVTPGPPFSVVHQRVPVGPFDGQLSGPMTAVEDLYHVNRNDTSGTTNTFWSFPDLRVNWDTTDWAGGAADGLYEISVEYYGYVSGPTGAPVVEEIPSTCFTPPSVPVGTFLIRVDNGALTAMFDAIYLWNPSTMRYLRDTALAQQPGDTATETPAEARALDFNGTALCEIMDLQSQYEVEIHYTVSHAGGYLRSYSLTAAPNDGSSGVGFVSDSFTAHTTPGNPVWNGPGSDDRARTGFKDCAYIFDLGARSRQQNGIVYVQRKHPRRAYYVLE